MKTIRRKNKSSIVEDLTNAQKFAFAPMAFPSNKVPSDKIKNAFSLLSIPFISASDKPDRIKKTFIPPADNNSVNRMNAFAHFY